MDFFKKLFGVSSPKGEIKKIEVIQKIPYIWDEFEEHKKKEVSPNYQDLTTCPYCGIGDQKPFMRKRNCKFCKSPVYSTKEHVYTQEQNEQLNDNAWFDEMEEFVKKNKKEPAYRKIRSRFPYEPEYDCMIAYFMSEIDGSLHSYLYDKIGREYSALGEYLWYVGNYRAAYFCKMLAGVMSAGEGWIYHYAFIRGREIAQKHQINMQEINDKVAIAFKDICSYFGFSEQFDILPGLVELDQKELMTFEYELEEGKNLLRNIHEEYSDKTLNARWRHLEQIDETPRYIAGKYF